MYIICMQELTSLTSHKLLALLTCIAVHCKHPSKLKELTVLPEGGTEREVGESDGMNNCCLILLMAGRYEEQLDFSFDIEGSGIESFAWF